MQTTPINWVFSITRLIDGLYRQWQRSKVPAFKNESLTRINPSGILTTALIGEQLLSTNRPHCNLAISAAPVTYTSRLLGRLLRTRFIGVVWLNKLGTSQILNKYLHSNTCNEPNDWPVLGTQFVLFVLQDVQDFFILNLIGEKIVKLYFPKMYSFHKSSDTHAHCSVTTAFLSGHYVRTLFPCYIFF